MKKYVVMVTETLMKSVIVAAESEWDAEYTVNNAWHRGKIILDAECFEDVDVRCEREAKSTDIYEEVE